MVFSTYILIARPINHDDAGAVEYGHYTVADGVVTLTDQKGEPIISGRIKIGYSAKIGADENSTMVAKRLLWRFYRATKSGSDFNRPLDYQPLGIA